MEGQGDSNGRGNRSRPAGGRAGHFHSVDASNKQHVDYVAEDGPAMRAVAMVSTTPSLAYDSLASDYSGLAGPVSVGLIRHSQVNVFKGGLSVKKEWSGEVKVPSCWILKNDKLEPVPLDFPLERTHREIYHVEPSDVASRISDALRILSIEAEYDCARAKAKCRTSDFVSFRIRLYAGGENNQPVVVEVQRRSGSGLSFMQSCRAILDAAEGIKICQSSKKRGPPPIGAMQCLQGRSPPCASAFSVALVPILPLLASEKRDSKILGMQNLSILTDPLKTSPTIAIKVCKIVALGDSVYSIRDDTLVFLERTVLSTGWDPDESENGMGYENQLCHLALVTFSNSFSVTGKDSSLSKAIEEQTWFADCLFPLLLQVVKNASSLPHSAHEAVCSISSLAEASGAARRLLLDGNWIEVLAGAREIGRIRHELLANESSRCLSLLGYES